MACVASYYALMHHAALSRMKGVMKLKATGFVSNIPLLKRMPPFGKAKLQPVVQRKESEISRLLSKSFRFLKNLHHSKQHKSNVDWRFAGFQSIVILQASYVHTLPLITHSQPSVSAALTFKQTRFVMIFSCRSRFKGLHCFANMKGVPFSILNTF